MKILSWGLTDQMVYVVSQLHPKVIVSVLFSSKNRALVITAKLIRKNIMQDDVRQRMGVVKLHVVAGIWTNPVSSFSVVSHLAKHYQIFSSIL